MLFVPWGGQCPRVLKRLHVPAVSWGLRAFWMKFSWMHRWVLPLSLVVFFLLSEAPPDFCQTRWLRGVWMEGNFTSQIPESEWRQFRISPCHRAEEHRGIQLLFSAKDVQQPFAGWVAGWSVKSFPSSAKWQSFVAQFSDGFVWGMSMNLTWMKMSWRHHVNADFSAYPMLRKELVSFWQSILEIRALRALRSERYVVFSIENISKNSQFRSLIDDFGMARKGNFGMAVNLRSSKTLLLGRIVLNLMPTSWSWSCKARPARPA